MLLTALADNLPFLSLTSLLFVIHLGLSCFTNKVESLGQRFVLLAHDYASRVAVRSVEDIPRHSLSSLAVGSRPSEALPLNHLMSRTLDSILPILGASGSARLNSTGIDPFQARIRPP